MQAHSPNPTEDQKSMEAAGKTGDHRVHRIPAGKHWCMTKPAHNCRNQPMPKSRDSAADMTAGRCSLG